jgi:type IV pilus assembly protein PilN
MVVRINLLPHRQIRREQRQKQFNSLLALVVIAGAAITFLGHSYIGSRIEHQQERNQRLQSAIAQLDKDIAEIKDLKNRISDVLARKQVVEDLQKGRGKAVILLDEIARQLPEGTYLKSVSQQGDLIRLEGVADTDTRVVTLIRNLAASKWMDSPELIQIQAVTINNLRQSAFTLTVKQVDPKESEKTEGEG